MTKTLLTKLLYLYKNWYKYWKKFLTIIGDIKIFKTPMFVIYDNRPFDYNLRGRDIRQMEDLLKPGDIVLRGYDHYLDGYLIPGKYSHSGIYVGDHNIIHAIAEGVCEVDVIDFLQCDRACIMRPNKGQKKAIARAKKWIGTEYDFKFNSSDSSAFYCHELCACCYKDTIDVTAFYPNVFGKKEVLWLGKQYLADSFIYNDNFEKIIEK